jgi:hypothetical protein
VNIQGPFREHSGNIRGIFREHSGNIQGIFREHSASPYLAVPKPDRPGQWERTINKCVRFCALWYKRVVRVRRPLPTSFL